MVLGWHLRGYIPEFAALLLHKMSSRGLIKLLDSSNYLDGEMMDTQLHSVMLWVFRIEADILKLCCFGFLTG
jgi:hypothetical protein